jgi:putative ABC transport system permease protein
VLGVLVGFGAHFVLLELIGKLLPADLPPVSLLPALQGIATGMLLLVGFALPPVLQLRNVPHNRVIRREQARRSRWRWPPTAWARRCSSACCCGRRAT